MQNLIFAAFMRPIQMVDLASQHLRIKEEVDNAIQIVISNTAFINGPDVKQFEKNLSSYLDVANVIACANGTDALQIAFMALDLQPGDEVITSAFSYAALAEVLLLLKLKPVFVEVDPNTFNIDVALIEKAITPKTKAIAPVHLFGQCADMEKIMEIAKKHHLFVVEDTAQAIGAVYTFSDGTKKRAGTIGHVGTTSFFPSKNLGCYGDGGAIFCNDEQLSIKLKMIANHGQKVKYTHDVVGVNSRLDTIQAAILNVKLQHLDEYEKARQHVAQRYSEGFKNNSFFKTPDISSNTTHVFHQYTLTLKGIDRDEFQGYLKEHNIPSMVYYPIPLHKQNAYRQDLSFPISEYLCKNVLSLPISTEMDNEQIDYIISTVNNFNPKIK